MAVTFDLFGTLVDADRPNDPAVAVARELAARGVCVPDDWAAAYREQHVDPPPGAEVPLPAHVARALASRGVEAPANAARRAVVAAFDPAVEARPGAREAVAAAHEHGPVGVLSNCAVPELARRALVRADLRGAFDAVTTSIGCGWRKPDERAFEAAERALGERIAIHVGDAEPDRGIERVGGQFVDVRTTPLGDIPELLAEVEG